MKRSQLEYSRRSRELKRARGECDRCPRPAPPNDRLCGPCRQKKRAATKAYIEKKKSNGQCIACDSPAKNGSPYCEFHLQSHRHYQKQVRADRRSKGKCSTCGINDAGDSWECESCKNITLTRGRDDRERRRKLNLCHSCGAPTGGKVLCCNCRKKQATDRSNKLASGLCVVPGCKNKNTHGQYCEFHRGMYYASHRSWSKSENGIKSKMANNNPVDINICLADALTDSEGRLLDFYTGIPVSMDCEDIINYRSGDHIDSESKGLLIDSNCGVDIWDSRDGRHNWILTTRSTNSSKHDSCLYEWHARVVLIRGLRPLADILDDMIRLGKRIPPIRGIVSDDVREMVNRYREIQIKEYRKAA